MILKICTADCNMPSKSFLVQIQNKIFVYKVIFPVKLPSSTASTVSVDTRLIIIFMIEFVADFFVDTLYLSDTQRDGSSTRFKVAIHQSVVVSSSASPRPYTHRFCRHYNALSYENDFTRQRHMNIYTSANVNVTHTTYTHIQPHTYIDTLPPPTHTHVYVCVSMKEITMYVLCTIDILYGEPRVSCPHTTTYVLAVIQGVLMENYTIR